MKNSSCMISWDGLSPSALSQSLEHPAPDQTPGEKAVKGELCSNSLTESIHNRHISRYSGKSSFLLFSVKLLEELLC